MSNEEKTAWDRQPHETSRSYELFCAYRDMGIERSLSKARNSASAMPSLARLKQVCKRWNWVERCRAYDDYLEREDRLQQEKERREMRKRHAKVGVLAQSIAIEGLKNLLAKVQGGDQAVAPTDLTRLLDTGVKVERLSRGEPTDSHELSGAGGGPVKLDLIQTLKRIDEVYGLKTEDGSGKTHDPGNGSGTSQS
jgi:hypothetical protein